MDPPWRWRFTWKSYTRVAGKHSRLESVASHMFIFLGITATQFAGVCQTPRAGNTLWYVLTPVRMYLGVYSTKRRPGYRDPNNKSKIKFRMEIPTPIRQCLLSEYCSWQGMQPVASIRYFRSVGMYRTSQDMGRTMLCLFMVWYELIPFPNVTSLTDGRSMIVPVSANQSWIKW